MGSKPLASFLHYSSCTFGARGSVGILRWKGPGAELMMFKILGLQNTEMNWELGRKRGCGKGLMSCLTCQGILWAVSCTSPVVQGSQDFAALRCRTCASDRVAVSGVSCCAPEARRGPWAGTPGHGQLCLSLEVPAIPQTRNRPHFFWKQVLSTPALFCFGG